MIRRRGIVLTIGLALMAALALFLSPSSIAQSVYHVRAGATGANNGSDWNNAYSSLPSTLQRGATYYIADGNYGGYTFDDPVSGTNVTTIKKATVAEHGTSTGWQDSYGDGQATFSGSWNFMTGYWVLDGVTGGGPGSWETGHGFKLLGEWGSPANQDVGLASITIRHTEQNIGATGPDPNKGGGRFDYVAGVTLSYCFMHNYGADVLKINGDTSNFTLEYSKVKNIYMDAASHSDPIECVYGNMANFVIRYNLFEDCIGTYCFGAHDDAQVTNYDIYGNIFNGASKALDFTDGFIAVLGCSRGNNGVLQNVRFYNNTIAGKIDRFMIGLNGCNVTGPIYARNNLVYSDNTGTETVGFGSATAEANTAYNVTVSGAENLTGNPLVNVSAGNFTLSAATTAGTSVANVGGQTFDKDMLGNTRGGDGKWDRGAIEFGGAPDTTPPTISGVGSSGVGATTATVSFNVNEPARGGMEYGVSTSYGATATNSSLLNSHSFGLSGLSPNTTYHYRVHAMDSSDNHAQSGDYTFMTTTPDTTPPAISGVTTNSVTTSSAIIIFSTSEAAVSGVEYGLTTSYGSTMTNTSYLSSHSLTLNNLSAGSTYHYRVHATDTAGNHAVGPDATFQTLSPDSVPPTVTLTAPTSGAIVSNTITLSAVASDNVGLVGVAFLVDGAQVGAEDTAAPYSISWDTFATANGVHTVAARARDTAGNQTTSSTVSITVANQAPSAAFNINDRVMVNSDPSLRVRSSAELLGTVLGSQPLGALGTIIAGPVIADGYTWWQIDYDNSPDGWSIEGDASVPWLVLAPTSKPAPPSGLKVASQ